MLENIFKKALFSFQWVLVVASLILLSLIVMIFYPGFMSFDSLNQYGQALGYLQLNDWHPPIMALVWRAGIKLTGLTGSFMILTVSTFVLSSLILSLFIYKITKNKLLSFLPLFFLLLPNTLTLLGVVWKDVFLAAAFMLGSVLILLGTSSHPRWDINNIRRNIFITSGVLTLIFGSSFRHGVWPAFLPLIMFASYKLCSGRKTKYIFIVFSFLLAMAFSSIISRIFNVSPGGASVVIMIDDIINTNSEQEIRSSILTTKSKDYLVDLQMKCKNMGIRNYAAFLCEETHVGFASTLSLEPSNTKNLWMSSIREKPFIYITHRTKSFLEFLSPPYIFAWQEKIEPNPYGLTAINSPPTKLAEHYIKFFIRDWPSIFKPYTWLVVIVILTGVVIRRKNELRHSVFMITVFSTAILFLLSFFPAAIVSDYRMTYTFTFACGLIAILLIIDSYDHRYLQKVKNSKLQKN